MNLTKVPDRVKIEYVLSAYLRPTFLIISRSDTEEEDNEIQILVSAHQFSYMNVQERIGHVFGILQKHCAEILLNKLIVVQAFDNSELEIVVDDIFNEEMFK